MRRDWRGLPTTVLAAVAVVAAVSMLAGCGSRDNGAGGVRAGAKIPASSGGAACGYASLAVAGGRWRRADGGAVAP
jgi:hypothetical protein